ncbi:MAG TPA: hypothetical protein VGG28_23005 [Kofleriaceae bacterium]
MLGLGQQEHERIVGVLRARGATIVADERDAPDVLLVGLGVDLQDVSPATYVIGVVDDDISAALACGCHDVLRAPFDDDELWARVDVLDRLAGWPLAPVGSRPSQRTIDAARAWRFLGDIVTTDLQQMFERRIELSQRLPLSPPIRVATIPMVLARDHIELALSIVADRVACEWLATVLLDDQNASADAIDDVLRELANVAGGSLKRGVLPEGLVLSTGIPVGGDARFAEELNAGVSVRSWCLELDAGVSLTVIADVRARPNRHVPASRLCEGMVLVGDVRNGDGAVLFAGGTRLTASGADHLGRLLGVTLVEVSPAA